MLEIRKIPFLDGLYATSDGRILDKEFNEFSHFIENGYYKVSVKGVKYKVHRLIAMVFIENPSNKSDVHHINFNKLDNRIENLLWVTREEHTSLHHKGKKHSEEHKRKVSNSLKGENHPNWGKHLSEEWIKKISKPVYQYTLNKELVKVYQSLTECDRNGFNKSGVSRCCNGKQKSYKGFIWSYVPLS